jgi:hypothetical protein
VVRVVVIDRIEGAGDEKVLPSPPPCVLNPSVPVVNVPALEYAASENVASPVVEMVGAADFCACQGSRILIAGVQRWVAPGARLRFCIMTIRV